MITTILNLYKRNHLSEQIQAIENQTIKSEIWINNNWNIEIPQRIKEKYVVIENNINWWVWYRFILWLNATTEYVCWFDDDTLPAPKRYENCLECMEKQEALYWTIGHKYQSEKSRRPYERVGFQTMNEKVEQVDIVWHSRFMKTERIKYLRDETPPLHKRPYNWEDMRLSYKLQEKGIKTMVPPHPKNNRALWGSVKGNEYGIKNASSVWKQDLYNEAYLWYIENWFKIMSSQNNK